MLNARIRFDKQLMKKHYWEKRLARRRRQAEKEIAWDKHNRVPEPRALNDFKNYLKAKRMVFSNLFQRTSLFEGISVLKVINPADYGD